MPNPIFGTPITADTFSNMESLGDPSLQFGGNPRFQSSYLRNFLKTNTITAPGNRFTVNVGLNSPIGISQGLLGKRLDSQSILSGMTNATNEMPPDSLRIDALGNLPLNFQQRYMRFFKPNASQQHVPVPGLAAADYQFAPAAGETSRPFSLTDIAAALGTNSTAIKQIFNTSDFGGLADLQAYRAAFPNVTNIVSVGPRSFASPTAPTQSWSKIGPYWKSTGPSGQTDVSVQTKPTFQDIPGFGFIPKTQPSTSYPLSRYYR